MIGSPHEGTVAADTLGDLDLQGPSLVAADGTRLHALGGAAF